MMKKSNKAIATIALASLGIGSLMYTYSKMHPLKSKMVVSDMKKMVKDLK